MKHSIGIAALAFALTACGGAVTDADADGDGEVTTEEVSAAIEASGKKLKPVAGKYKTSITVTKVDVPGAPPQMAEMMGSAMNQENEFCLTPEQAEKGFEDSLKQGRDDTCKISTFTLDGDQVDMKMSCNDPASGPVTVAMTGQVGETSSDLQMTVNGKIPQMGDMEMVMSFTQTRIGDCEG